MTDFKAMQQAYDAMEPPSYWDEDPNPEIMDALEAAFDETFLERGLPETALVLLLKICKNESTPEDLETLKEEMTLWYSAELEEYCDSNYDELEQKMRDAAADDGYDGD